MIREYMISLRCVNILNIIKYSSRKVTERQSTGICQSTTYTALTDKVEHSTTGRHPFTTAEDAKELIFLVRLKLTVLLWASA